MSAVKPLPQKPLQPLENGQLWRVGDGTLKIVALGKLLVSYKLGKLDAVRVPKSMNSITAVERYLRENKAVLIQP
ncbi:MAG TPA: hypothetical protein VL527_08630 [Dongiaceae bacterium]|nr:hypothetical protein [Dongiaceae bacterium]